MTFVVLSGMHRTRGCRLWRTGQQPHYIWPMATRSRRSGRYTPPGQPMRVEQQRPRPNPLEVMQAWQRAHAGKSVIGHSLFTAWRLRAEVDGSTPMPSNDPIALPPHTRCTTQSSPSTPAVPPGDPTRLAAGCSNSRQPDGVPPHPSPAQGRSPDANTKSLPWPPVATPPHRSPPSSASEYAPSKPTSPTPTPNSGSPANSSSCAVLRSSDSHRIRSFHGLRRDGYTTPDRNIVRSLYGCQRAECLIDTTK